MAEEIMKDAELDAVVGGSGIECMGLMARLQSEGLAKFNTPLVAGNEVAAAKELQAYLDTFSDKDSFKATVYADNTPNEYRCSISSSWTNPDGSSGAELQWGFGSADDLIKYIRSRKG